MTRINHHALGASRRLPPRITLLASSTKYKFKEERKRILKLSVKKLRSIEDPEAFLSKSVLINNTLKRLQTEVREEKAERKKSAELPTYSPSPYSFYSIEKAYREEMDRAELCGSGLGPSLDTNGNNPDTTSSFCASTANQHQQATTRDLPGDSYVSLHAAAAAVSVQNACLTSDQHMLDADDEDSGSGADSSTSSTSGDSSSSDEECDENTMRSPEPETSNVSSAPSSVSSEQLVNPEINSVEDDLLSEVYMPTPSVPPPHDPIDGVAGMEPGTGLLGVPMRPSTPVPWSSNMDSDTNNPCGNKLAGVGNNTGIDKVLGLNPSAEAVIKSSETGCDTSEDLWSEAVRTECWTKPVDSAPSSVAIRTTLTASSTVNTNTMSMHHWPSVDWPTYTPSTTPCSSAVAHSASGPSSASPALTASTASVASTVSASTAFSPNIALPVTLQQQCANSHKENLFSATIQASTNHHHQGLNHFGQNSISDDRSKQNTSPNPSSHSSPSSLSDKCYSCGQSSLFQSELQSVVFNSLIASLET